MPLSVEQFTERLTSSGVFSDEQLRESLAGLTADSAAIADGEALARELVKLKKLTKFQAEQIYAGKGTSLTLGNYVILDKLGQGGMGMVLKAWHRRMERTVALKVIAPRVVKDAVALKRFQREVVAAAKLTHPNIVAAYDADEAKGTHFLVMEYVDGTDLSAFVKKNGPMPIEMAVNCIVQAARGLQFAHEQGVIHRDIKPHNLLMKVVSGPSSAVTDSNGPQTTDYGLTVKILDMGLARLEGNVGGSAEHADLTNSGAMMGTVDYMAPEQAMDSKHADARSDIYSLGCTLFYLLTGHATFVADTVMKRLTAHQNAPPPSLTEEAVRAGINSSSAQLAALNAVFQRMVSKRPLDRFQSMGEVITALERCRAALDAGSDSATTSDVSLQSFLRDITGESSTATRTTATSPAQTAVLPNDDATIVEQEFAHDTDATLHETIAREANAPNLPSRKSSRGVLIAGVLVTALLLAVGLFAMRGPSGTLHLEISDELTQVTVGETGRVVKGTSEQDLRLPTGEYVLHIEREKLAFDTDAFGLTKNKIVSIKVERVGRRVRAMMGKTLLGHKEEPRGRSDAIASAGGSPPPLAVAPFDAKQARAHQEAWARHLGTEVETTNSVGAKMILIPPGEFLMGSSDEQVEALKTVAEVKAESYIFEGIERTERPQHKVVITKPFLMSATEVTIGQFKQFAATTGYLIEAEKAKDAKAASPFVTSQPSPKPTQTYLNPGYAVTDDSPASAISWNDAVAYCQWLSEKEKRAYRLPTEAEWEYACRAGTMTHYSFGDDYHELPKYGWHSKNYGEKSRRVERLLPNPFGLFDMHGSLYEWCEDYWDQKWYEKSRTNDPNGPSVGSTRVLRSGHWLHIASNCRSAHRAHHPPSIRHVNNGFRCVAELSMSATVAPASVTAVDAVRRSLNTATESHALQFDGAGSRVEIPDLLMDVAQPMTIEVWALPSMPVNNGVVAGFVGQCTLRLKGQQWRFSMRDAKAGSYGVFAISDADMKKPSHVAGVWDGSHIQLFVNGIRHGDAVPCPDLATAKGMATFGATADGVDPFAGQILQARFSRIARYSDDFDPPKMFAADESTVGLYHFADGVGSTLTDSSNHRRHGKIVGAKWVAAPANSSASSDSSRPVSERSTAAMSRPDRVAAEWVISVQGSVSIREPGRPPRLISQADQLPSGEFEVAYINIQSAANKDRVTDDSLRHLRSLKALKMLNLNDCRNISAAGLRNLVDSPLLESIDLNFSKVDDQAVEELVKLRSLKTVNVGESQITDAGIERLCRELPVLENLSLSARSTDKSLKALVEARNLKSLNVLKSKHLTDDGIGWLLNAPQITTLNIVTATDELLRKVEALTQTTALYLNLCPATPTGIQSLAKLPRLEALGLSDSPMIGDEHLEKLSEMRTVTELLLAKTGVTDHGIISLVGITNLRVLSLKETAITDQAVTDLSRMTNLRRLNITETKLTSEGVDTLRKALSNCRITSDHGTFGPLLPLNDVPPPAKAPFDAKQAREHQERWARHLGTTVETGNSLGMKLTLIPPGEFLMGSTPEQVAIGKKLGEQDKNIKSDDLYWSFLPSETPQRPVTLTRPFWMGTTEVTIGQFRKFVEATKYVTYAERYGFGDSAETLKTATANQTVKESQKGLSWRSSGEAAGDEFPVGQVTWDDACAFCAWLSEQEGLTPWYRNDDRRGFAVVAQANGYRLPTEAEWEYACRAGTTSQFWHGDEVTQLAQHELYADSAAYELRPVGSKRPNPFGLFDMSGCVREWCQDFFDAKLYEQGPAVDPLGPATGRTHAIRGGSFAGKAAYLRSAYRYGSVVSNRSTTSGFRLVRVIEATARPNK